MPGKHSIKLQPEKLTSARRYKVKMENAGPHRMALVAPSQRNPFATNPDGFRGGKSEFKPITDAILPACFCHRFQKRILIASPMD